MTKSSWLNMMKFSCRGRICQLFFTIKSPKFPILPETTQNSWHFWSRIENGECFTHLFWTSCQFLRNYLFKHLLNPLLFEDSSLISLNFTDRVIFCICSWKKELWQISCLVSYHRSYHIITVRWWWQNP